MKTLHVKLGNWHQHNLTKKRSNGKGRKPFHFWSISILVNTFILWQWNFLCFTREKISSQWRRRRWKVRKKRKRKIQEIPIKKLCWKCSCIVKDAAKKFLDAWKDLMVIFEWFTSYVCVSFVLLFILIIKFVHIWMIRSGRCCDR